MRLSDVCEFIVDCPHSTAKDEGEGFPLIRTPNIGKGRLILEGVHRVSESVYNKRNARAVPQDDDLIFAREAPAGNVAIIKHGEKVCLGQRTVLLRPNKKLVNPDFLAYFLLAPEQQYGLLGTANGATVAHVNIPTIRELKIQLPSLEQQTRIAEIITAYDDLIENNQRQIKLLEEAAQRLYKEWFVDLRFPGHETTPIIGGIPEGWQLSTVGECTALLRRGISPKYSEEGTSVVINQKCIRQSVVDLGEARRQEKAFPAEMNLIDSDTVICSTGAGTLGRVGQVFGEYPHTTFDSHVTLVRAGNTIGKQYLYQFLKSKQPYLQGMGKGSTNQLELSRGTIQELPILAPHSVICKAFEQQVQPIHDEIRVLSKQIALLWEARDTLLPKLMNGEIEV